MFSIVSDQSTRTRPQLGMEPRAEVHSYMTQWNFWDPPGLAQSIGTTSAAKTTVKSKMPQLWSGLFGYIDQ